MRLRVRVCVCLCVYGLRGLRELSWPFASGELRSPVTRSDASCNLGDVSFGIYIRAPRGEVELSCAIQMKVIDSGRCNMESK